MSKKGVSAEEKRNRMLQLFYEKGECFQLKELEKIAPKEKGIVAGSVKEVLQYLVENELVDTDKIGTSIYFWSFPSNAIKVKKRQLKDVLEKNDQITKKLKLLEEAINSSKTGDETTRTKLIEEINDKEIELNSLNQTLKHFEKNDPRQYDELVKKTGELKEAANRWTDNIFAIKSWCKKKFMVEDKILNKQFGISEEFDYVE